MSEDETRENRRLSQELRLLPLHDLTPDHSRQMITSALAVFRRRRGRGCRWLAALALLYGRFLEPLWLAAFSAAFLVWAVHNAALLLR